MDQILGLEPGGLLPAQLVLGGIAEADHGGGDHMLGQLQQFFVEFKILNDVADVAAAQAQTLGGHHCILGGDDGVGLGQEQVAHAGVSCAGGIAGEGLVPAAVVGAEDQHQGGRGDEGLVVAALRQGGLDGRVGDVEDGVQGHVARRGGLDGGVDDGGFHFGFHGAVFVDPDGFTVFQLSDGIVHGGGSFFLFSIAYERNPA